MKLNFKKIEPYDGAYTYWVAGIYKIVSYRRGQYHAYFIQDHARNWGDHVEKPPHQFHIANGMYSSGWKSLREAQAACRRHARSYTPAPATVERAAEITADWIARWGVVKHIPSVYKLKTGPRICDDKDYGEYDD